MGGMTRLLLLLWAGVTVGSVVDLQKRIIGGHDCSQDERHYHVVLKINDSKDIFCGGSLISNKWILTAAHCWKPGWTIRAVLGRHPNTVGVMIRDDPVIFKDKTGRNHDIMLLKIPGHTEVPHVPLPDCNKKPNIGNEVQIAGHGPSTTAPGDLHVPVPLDESKLQCANTNVVGDQNFKNCLQKKFPETFVYMYQDLLCYQKVGVDTAPGDSGGGVVFNGMIYGVHVSSGERACSVAAASMDVCSYKDWIKSTTGIH